MLEEERRLFYVGITRAERKLYLTHAEERRRNGEFMPSRRRAFSSPFPRRCSSKRNTIKVRSSGRAVMRGPASGWGSCGTARRRRTARFARDGRRLRRTVSAVAPRRAGPGTPVTRESCFADDENASQDAPVIAVGARVKHRKFGSGTIAELAGTGRDAEGEGRLRRRDDRAQDARRRAGEPRARRSTRGGHARRRPAHRRARAPRHLRRRARASSSRS